MATSIAHPSLGERKAKGLLAWDQADPSSHAGWGPPPTARTRSPCAALEVAIALGHDARAAPQDPDGPIAAGRGF